MWSMATENSLYCLIIHLKNGHIGYQNFDIFLEFHKENMLPIKFNIVMYIV